jgi:hypothetical protein
LTSFDCVDSPVQEPWPFDKAMYSEKFNGPGYKYEIGISIRNCDIVRLNGPFKAGKADCTIFHENGTKDALCDDECIEVDRGNQGHDKLKTPNIAQSREDRIQKSNVRARHEIVNGWLKKFKIIDDVFRHPLERHSIAFTAVAVVVQLKFELEQRLYDVEYNAHYN